MYANYLSDGLCYTTFVRVTKSDQTLFNVGVSICMDFSTEK